MKLKQHLTPVTTACTLALGLAISAPASAGGMLKAAVADWTGGAIMCEIIHSIVEQELDYKVKRVVMPSGPNVQAGIRAGDIDYACENWPSYNTNNAEHITEFGGDGSVVKLADSGVVGVSGYYVPRYLVEGDDAKAPNLKTWENMNEYADLFKTLESGDKGRLIGCPVSAWECDDTKRAEALGLNYVVTELGSEAAHWAELQAAFKRKEAFIAYAWEPHWIHAALDLVKVELPPHSDEAWPATGWANDITFNYGSPELLEEHPEVAKLIQNFRLTNDMQAPMILAVDVDGKDAEDVVAEWLASNEDTWKGWLPK